MFAEIGAQSIRGARVLQVVNGEERDFLLGSWRSQLVGAAQARVFSTYAWRSCATHCDVANHMGVSGYLILGSL